MNTLNQATTNQAQQTNTVIRTLNSLIAQITASKSTTTTKRKPRVVRLDNRFGGRGVGPMER